MSSRDYLDLFLENGWPFYLRHDLITNLVDELEEFLSLANNMNSREFAKKVMFSHELKANNLVEGYCDSLDLIEDIIKRKVSNIKDENKRKRILNMYRGYQFILTHTKVDEIHLKNLYQILSNDLIDHEDEIRMDEFYRTAPVYILMNGRFDLELEEGVDANNIRKLITFYLDYFNNSLATGDMTMDYINSQILHFYFVYIHPYFDVNGRTSRTMAMWHLIKNKAYPYIIFNRGISFRGVEYDKIIRDAKHSQDLTYFIRYMLKTVKVELEKEYVMQSIASNTHHKLTGIDYQSILYFLTMNGMKTASDFVTFYNRLNDRKKSSEIYQEMIVPLIDMDILKVVRYTKGYMYGNTSNMVLELNKQKIDDDPQKIKRLHL